jgi:ATP-dependent DNA helicase RecG
VRPKTLKHIFLVGFAHVFFRAGQIETWGRGIEKIFDACAASGLPEPRYGDTGATLRLTFPFADLPPNIPSDGTINDGINDGIKHIKTDQHILAQLSQNAQETTQETTQEKMQGRLESRLESRLAAKVILLLDQPDGIRIHCHDPTRKTILNSQFSILNSQFSILNSQLSILFQAPPPPSPALWP